MAINELSFIGSDNEINLIVSDSDGPINFVSNGVTKIDVYINGEAISSDGANVSFLDGGIINIKPGFVSSITDGGDYSMSIKVFDPMHANGQVVVNHSLSNSCVNVRGCKSD